MINVLLIGGTGVISTDIVLYALKKPNINLYILNRGKTRSDLPNDINLIKADINKTDEVKTALKGMKFDVVCDFISFSTEALLKKLKIFKDICSQYIFISLSTVYRHNYSCPQLIREGEYPIGNFAWNYSKEKYLCEELLKQKCSKYKLKYTIVRPCYTYNNVRFMHMWTIPHQQSFTIANRIIKKKPLIFYDGGNQKVTVTHASDFAKAFVGLWMNNKAFNEDFNITGTEYLTHKEIAEIEAEILGEKLRTVDIPAEKLYQYLPEDKFHGAFAKVMSTTHNECFDNSKIKNAVPEFETTTDFKKGISQTINFYMNNPKLQIINKDWDCVFDLIAKDYK